MPSSKNQAPTCETTHWLINKEAWKEAKTFNREIREKDFNHGWTQISTDGQKLRSQAALV